MDCIDNCIESRILQQKNMDCMDFVSSLGFYYKKIWIVWILDGYELNLLQFSRNFIIRISFKKKIIKKIHFSFS